MIMIDYNKIYSIYKTYSIKYKLIYLLSYILPSIIVFLTTKYFIFGYNVDSNVNLKTVFLFSISLFSTISFYFYLIDVNISDYGKIKQNKTSLLLDLESNTIKHIPFRIKSDNTGIVQFLIFYIFLIINFISLTISNSYMFYITYIIFVVWSMLSVGMVNFEKYEKPILKSDAKNTYLFLKRYDSDILSKFNLYGEISKENKNKIINEINNNKNMAKINAFILKNKKDLNTSMRNNYFNNHNESTIVIRKMRNTFAKEYVKIFINVLRESNKSSKKENKLLEKKLLKSFEKFIID